MEDKKVKLEVQSHYNYLYEFMERSGVTLIILLLLLVISIQYDILLPYLIVLGMYIIITIACTIYVKLQYNACKYKFYEDKVIFTDSFINKESKRIKYEDIKEVRVNQHFLQMPFKLGTITISTNSGKFFDNGIVICGVQDINETYAKIEKILEDWQEQHSK